MENAGILLKVSSDEYRFLLSVRNMFSDVESLREVLKQTSCDDKLSKSLLSEFLKQTS